MTHTETNPAGVVASDTTAGVGWRTHEVTNQVDELSGYSLLETDAALKEAR